MRSEYYQLTEEDNEALKYHKLTFQEIDDIGFDILDIVLSNPNPIPNYYIPIRGLLYRLLELNDALSVMVSQSLINTSFSLSRNILEISAQLIYLLDDSESIEEKSMLYHYCDIRQQNINIDKTQLENHLTSSFQKIHTKVIEIKKYEKFSWYSLFEEKRVTFKDLCEKINFKEYYDTLYPHLSSDIHGTAILELNTIFNEEDKKYYLRDFRHFERHHTLMTFQIDFMRKVFINFQNSFQIPKEIALKIDSFNDRASAYIDTYKSLKGTILDPLPHYSI